MDDSDSDEDLAVKIASKSRKRRIDSVESRGRRVSASAKRAASAPVVSNRSQSNVGVSNVGTHAPSSSTSSVPSAPKPFDPQSGQFLPDDEKWDINIARLTAFKQKNGHCDVPKRYPKDPKLGRWVSALRYNKKRDDRGEQSMVSLTPDRIAQLNSMGFKWSAKRGPVVGNKTA